MTRRSTPQHVLGDRRFPVRVRVAVPPGRFGPKLNEMYTWLDRRAGRDGYATWSEAGRGQADAMLIYARDLEMVPEFVAQFELRLVDGH